MDNLPPPMAARRPNFWQNSGYALLVPDLHGHLSVTESFLKAYLQRPEIAPVEESCDKERALHAALLNEPKRPVSGAEIDKLEDADGRDNYRVLIDFRDRLVAAGTLEACYLNLFRDGNIKTAPIFLDQMTQIITRAVLDGTDDPFRARAGEILFREQTVTVHEGAILSGDLETVEMLASTGGMGTIGELLVEGGIKPRQVELDVMQAENAHKYWQRDERHDMVLDLSFARQGLDALCRVLEGWVQHFTGAEVQIQPVQKITDEKWVWHIGLDTESSALLNDLYDDRDVDEERMERLLTLFRMDFKDPSLMQADIAGRPIYMGLAMNEKKRLRLKPQNLLVNLPLAPEA
jgi:hypothetical protein